MNNADKLDEIENEVEIVKCSYSAGMLTEEQFNNAIAFLDKEKEEVFKTLLN